MTRQELIDQALFIATAGLGNEAFLLRDDPAVAEVLIPQALRRLSQQLAAQPAYAYRLRRTENLSFTNGAAEIPAAVLPEQFGSAELRVPEADAGGLASQVVQWVANYTEFTGWQQSGYWYALARDGQILLRDAHGPLQDAGELLLDAAMELADAALDTLAASEEADLVAQLAAMLRDFNKVSG